MRIGQVSKKYNISIDNLYYYINYGLLVPAKPGAQYDFDERTLNDLETILELKSMDFSLKEIHKILSLYRISDMAVMQDIEDLKKIYKTRLSSMKREKLQLEKNINRLDDKISELSNMLTGTKENFGLPINMLDYLCCPYCHSSFSIENVSMNLKHIFDGKLECKCGYSAQIEDGILLTPNKNTDVYDTPDTERKLYKDLPPALISLFQRSYNWMVEKLEGMDLSGKVVLETYINAWCFIQNHLPYLDKNGKYIIVDKYPEMLYMYKTLIEKQGYDLDILFIADSGTKLPLKSKCVDLNIDYFAVNEHNFYHDTFLYDEIASFLKEDAKMLGTYFYFDHGVNSMKNLLKEYPSTSDRNFNLSYFLSNMKDSILDQEICGFATSTGMNIGFSFHHEGEKMYLRSYLASMRKYKEKTVD